MPLQKDNVENIAHLARIAINEEDIPAYSENLSSILQLVEQMNAVDTSGISPMAHPLDVSQRLRADEVTESDHRDDYQKNAPLVEDGLFLVPKVIE